MYQTVLCVLLSSWCSVTAADTNALIIGGSCLDTNTLCHEVEMIKPQAVCVVDIPSMPFDRQEAEAVYFKEKVWVCGGSDNFINEHNNKCHSYHLGAGDMEDAWVEEPSMVFKRARFGMSVIGDNIYVSGGFNADADQTVEMLKDGEGWEEVENMHLDETRYGHCSVSLNDEVLVLIGGFVGGFVADTPSTSVISYNVKEDSGKWEVLSAMQEGRYTPACTTGWFEEQFGIFVTGGFGDGDYKTSVEFYIPEADAWLSLSPLNQERTGHSIFNVGDNIIMVAGGLVKSSEVLVGDHWFRSVSLQEARWSSAEVSFPAGHLSCKQ